jgi:putative oxidoreductase
MTPAESPFQSVASLVGRLMVALLFWWSGIFGFVMAWEASVGMIAARGLPAPVALGMAAAALEIVGPVALLVPRTAVWAALALSLFCLLTAVLFHPYWAATAEDRFVETVNFFKDIALSGALLTIAAERWGRG